VEVWQTSNLRRLRLGEEKKERRTNHSMKIYMVSLLHRATIKIDTRHDSFISMRTRAHLSPDILNVCVCGGVHGVITGNKLHTGSENWGLPLTWLIALTTTVQHTVLRMAAR